MHGTHRHYHHSHRRRYSCEHFVNCNDGQPLSFCSCFTGHSLLLFYKDLIWHSNAWKNSLTRPIQFPLRDNQLFWTITAFLKDPFHPLPIWQVERKLNILKWQCITFSSPTYPQPPPQLSLPSPHILPFSLQPLTSPTPSLVSLSTAVHRGLAVCVTDARACDARSQLSKRARVHSVSCWSSSSSSSSSSSCVHCLSILQMVLLVHKTIPLLVNEARMVGLVNKTMLKIILMVLVHKTMVWGWGGHIMVGVHPTILATTDNEANWIKVQHLIQRNWFLVLPIIK